MRLVDANISIDAMPTGQFQAWPNNSLDRAVKLTRTAALVLCALVWAACNTTVQPTGQNADDSPVGRAFNSRESGVQVEGEGVVTRILEDDLSGSRHQRFILRLSSGQTVLITHNIDVVPRVPDIKEGDSVSFYGVYEWNEKGGTVHWTHHDPQGKHVPGWLKHNGRTYQ